MYKNVFFFFMIKIRFYYWTYGRRQWRDSTIFINRAQQLTGPISRLFLGGHIYPSIRIFETWWSPENCRRTPFVPDRNARESETKQRRRLRFILYLRSRYNFQFKFITDVALTESCSAGNTVQIFEIPHICPPTFSAISRLPNSGFPLTSGIVIF